MSWMSKKVGGWWDKASGANQKYDPNQLGREYDESMQGVNAGYDKISEYAEGMMDPYSQQNMAQRSMMEQQGADAAAQSSRLAGRNAAMAGGAPAGALAAQTASTANQSLAGSNNAFNQYLQGAQGQGASMLSGVLANQGQMQNQKFNMVNSQRQANAQADTQGAQFGANLLGQAIGMIPGLQEGGMAYDNIDHHIAYDGYQNGGEVGADGKQHYFLGGLAASIGVGALKKGYDAIGGEGFKEKMGTIGTAVGNVKAGVGDYMETMKEEAGQRDYHKTEQEARDAARDQFFASPEGKEAEATYRGLGTSNKEFNAANKNLIEGDVGYQTREQVGDARVQAGKDKYAQDYDIEGGEHRVGATRARLEDFRNNEGVKTVGKGIAGTYGLAKAGAGVGKDAIVGGTGLLAGAIGTGAGAVGKGAMTAGKAIKKDWQKEKGSIGKGLLRGASTLLKEVGSPGYMQGKEMANIKYGDKLGLKKVETEEPTKQPKLVAPTQNESDQASLVDPNKTPGRVASPDEDNRVEINGEKIVPDVLLSKVKSTTDLANLDPEQIKNIQASLKAAGYDMTSSEVDGGGMDGKAGPDTMKRMQEYIEKQGKQQGGFIGMQGGGDPAEYRAQLEGSDAEWESKLSSNLYTQEGDYTREGLLDRYGFSNEAVVDTSYGGDGPNQAVGMNISEGDRRTKLNLGAGNRWEGDKDTAEATTKSEWSAADRAAGRGYTFGEGYHPDSYAGYQTAKLKEESAKEMEDFFGPGGFQEGGTVWNPAKPTTNHSGMLSRVMGPNGEMGIKTRMGGFKIG